MKRVIFVLAVIPVGWTTLVCGQQSLILSRLALSDAIRIAIGQNPELKAARKNIDIAEADLVDASKRLNPVLTINSESFPLFESNQGGFLNNQELVARFDYEIETSGKRRLRTKVAGQQIEIERLRYQNAERELALRVKRVYFEVVLAQTNLDLAQQILGDIDQVIALDRVRFRQGEISGGELKRVEVERLRFLDDVFATQLALRNAQSTLLALMGLENLDVNFRAVEPLALDLSQPRRFIGLPPPLPVAELQQRALTQRPDMAAAFHAERRADTETLRQRALRTSNVIVGGGYKRDFGVNSVVFGVTIPLRIFNRNQGGVARALAQREQAQHRAEAIDRLIRLEVRKAHNAVEINRQRVEYIEREYLQKSDESRNIVLASYRFGEANLVDLLDAERAYAATRQVYNQALFDYRFSLYELGAAIGLTATE